MHFASFHERLPRHFKYRRGRIEAGKIDCCIEASVSLDRAFRERRNVLFALDVAFHGNSADGFGNRLELVQPSCRKDQFRAFLCEAACAGCAHAALIGCTQYDDDFVI